MIDISVIIPTYKPQYYLRQCLDTILNQTLPRNKYEVLIILNGCNEPYYTNIKKYIDDKGKSYNIHLYQTDTPGVSHARNIGIDNSLGQFITFVDDDDIISNNYLSAFLQQKPDQHTIVESNVSCFTSDVNNTTDDYLGIAFRQCHNSPHLSKFKARSFFSTSCCKIIPKEIINNRRFNTHFRIGEDSLFMALISDQIKHIKTTDPKARYYRRLRIGSASRLRKPFMQRISNSLKLIKAYTSIYFSAPGKYDLFFFSTRIAAVLINSIK